MLLDERPRKREIYAELPKCSSIFLKVNLCIVFGREGSKYWRIRDGPRMEHLDRRHLSVLKFTREGLKDRAQLVSLPRKSVEN